MLARVTIIVTLVCAATSAHAGSRSRVALVGGDATLRGAVQTALAPWGVDVHLVVGAAIRGRDAASRFASRDDVLAVVWFRPVGPSTQLRMYDRKSGRLATVPLPAPPPFDAPTAAAVALNIKALLRHSEVAPVTERVTVEEPPRPATQSPLFLQVGGGVQFPRTDTRAAVAALRSALVWHPAVLDSRLRLTAEYEYRDQTSITTTQLQGVFREHSVGAAVGLRFPFGTRLELGTEVGASLRFAGLEGELVGRGERVKVDRINPTVDAAIEAQTRLVGSLRLVLRGRVSARLRRQTYFVGQDRVLTLRRVDAGVQLAVSVPLY